MKYALKSMTCPKSSSARVVDGKLILSFPEALTPVVWQMDLTQAKASALEVLQNKKDSLFTLSLKSAKGEAVEIASFSKREQAVGGLMAASRALENAHGQIRPAAPQTNAAPIHYAKTRSSSKWLPAFLGIGMVAVLFLIWGSLASRMSDTLEPSTASLSTTSAPDESAAGIPIPADAFLRNR